jgi:hypothetical protein
LAEAWNQPCYFHLAKAKDTQHFLEIRKKIINEEDNCHQIIVTCTGDAAESISESERDYEIQSRIMKGRKKALNKILNWWKVNKLT